MLINNTTPLIDVRSMAYPKTLNDVRVEYPNVSFSSVNTSELIESYGFKPVIRTDRPLGDVVTEGNPTLNADGNYYQTFIVRDYNDVELATNLTNAKERLRLDIHALRNNELDHGYDYVLDEETTFGVQVRNEDRINLVGLKSVVGQMVAAGIDQPTLFRSRENITYTLTVAQVDDLCNKALMFFNSVYTASWTLLDQVSAAVTIAELPELPAKLVP